MSALETVSPVHADNDPRRHGCGLWECTSSIARNPERIMSVVVNELAATHGDASAILSDAESYTYRELSERVNQYARWEVSAVNGVRKGDVVARRKTGNRPEYFAIWLGITSVGGWSRC